MQYRETSHYPAALQASTGRAKAMMLLSCPARPARL
jgi:hypothetical protein